MLGVVFNGESVCPSGVGEEFFLFVTSDGGSLLLETAAASLLLLGLGLGLLLGVAGTSWLRSWGSSGSGADGSGGNHGADPSLSALEIRGKIIRLYR